MGQDTAHNSITEIFPITHAELAWQTELPSSVTICQVLQKQNQMWLKIEIKHEQQKQKYDFSRLNNKPPMFSSNIWKHLLVATCCCVYCSFRDETLWYVNLAVRMNSLAINKKNKKLRWKVKNKVLMIIFDIYKLTAKMYFKNKWNIPTKTDLN